MNAMKVSNPSYMSTIDFSKWSDSLPTSSSISSESPNQIKTMNPILRIRQLEHAINANKKLIHKLSNDPAKNLVVTDLQSDIQDFESEKLALIPEGLLNEITPCLRP